MKITVGKLKKVVQEALDEAPVPKRTGWRIKPSSRVAAREDLKLYKDRDAVPGGLSHVQGGDWEWLKRAKVVVPAGTQGTIVGVPSSRSKYTAQHSSGQLTVEWDNGLTTTVMRYDLAPV